MNMRLHPKGPFVPTPPRTVEATREGFVSRDLRWRGFDPPADGEEQCFDTLDVRDAQAKDGVR